MSRCLKIREWLRAQGEPRTTRQIREGLGLTAIEARGAIREMVRRKVLSRDGGRGLATYTVLQEPLSMRECQRRSTLARSANAAARPRIRTTVRRSISEGQPKPAEPRHERGQSVEEWLANGGRVQRLECGAVSQSVLRFNYARAA